MFPTFTDIKISSSSCRWWQTFLVKAFNPLCEEGEILQIWPTKFQQPYFSNHKVFLKPKLIEKFALSSENNLRESGKVLTNFICFLKTFFRLPFFRQNLGSQELFLTKKVPFYYVPIFMWSKDVCFAYSFWYFPKRMLENQRNLHIALIHH